MTSPRRRRAMGRLPLSVPVVSAFVALVTLATGVGVTLSGWTAALITNSGNTVQTATLSFSGAGPLGNPWTCAANGMATAFCPGTLGPYLKSTVPGTAGLYTTSGSNTFKNSSTVPAGAAFTQQVQVDSCAPAQFANTGTATTDPLLPRFGRVTFQVPDPWVATAPTSTSAARFNTTASALDAAGSMAADINTTSTNSLGSNYSIGLWFRKTTAAAGAAGLLSLSPTPTGVVGTTGSAIALYLSTTGFVRFRAPSTVGFMTGTSAAAITDTNWHLVVLTVSTLGANLYVDNAAAVPVTATPALTATAGYFHVGWVDTSGTALTNPPTTTTAPFSGDLAGAFVMQSVLASGTVSNLYTTKATGTAATYAGLLTGATNLWMLGDSGTSTYTGNVAYLGTSKDPCTYVDMKWTVGTPSFNYVPAPQVATLSIALSTGAARTTLPVTATTSALASGAIVTVTNASRANTQQWTLTAAAGVGATSLAVSSQTPNFAYPIGTQVYPTTTIRQAVTNGLMPSGSPFLAAPASGPTGLQTSFGVSQDPTYLAVMTGLRLVCPQRQVITLTTPSSTWSMTLRFNTWAATVLG